MKRFLTFCFLSLLVVCCWADSYTLKLADVDYEEIEQSFPSLPHIKIKGIKSFTAQNVTELIVPKSFNKRDSKGTLVPVTLDSVSLRVYSNVDGTLLNGVTKVTFTEGVKGFASHLLDGFPKVSSLVIPSSVVVLYDSCFAGASIKTLTIPNAQTSELSLSVSGRAFIDCAMLETFQLSESAGPLSVERDGKLLCRQVAGKTKAMTMLLAVTNACHERVMQVDYDLIGEYALMPDAAIDNLICNKKVSIGRHAFNANLKMLGFPTGCLNESGVALSFEGLDPNCIINIPEASTQLKANLTAAGLACQTLVKDNGLTYMISPASLTDSAEKYSMLYSAAENTDRCLSVPKQITVGDEECKLYFFLDNCFSGHPCQVLSFHVYPKDALLGHHLLVGCSNLRILDVHTSPWSIYPSKLYDDTFSDVPSEIQLLMPYNCDFAKSTGWKHFKNSACTIFDSYDHKDGTFYNCSYREIGFFANTNEIGETYELPARYLVNQSKGLEEHLMDWALSNFKQLKTLILPHNLSLIGNYALYGCDNLKTIHCYAPVPPTLKSSQSLSGLPQDVTVYVPVSALEAYKEAEGWMNLNIVAEDFDVYYEDCIAYFLHPETHTAEVLLAEETVIPSTVSKDGEEYTVVALLSKSIPFMENGIISIPATVQRVEPQAIYRYKWAQGIYFNGPTEVAGDFLDLTGSITISPSIYCLSDEPTHCTNPELLPSTIKEIHVHLGCADTYRTLGNWGSIEILDDYDTNYSTKMLTFHNQYITPGQEDYVTITANTLAGFNYLSFRLELPEGVTLVTDENGKPEVTWISNYRFATDISQMTDQGYVFALDYGNYSSECAVIAIDICRIKVRSDQFQKNSYVRLRDVKLKTVEHNSTLATYDDLRGYLSPRVIGDINYDDQADVADIVLLQNRLNNRESFSVEDKRRLNMKNTNYLVSTPQLEMLREMVLSK